MVTPQTNTTLVEIAEALLAHDDYLICGHVSPDGDCVGSALVLAHSLRSLGKTVTCSLAKDEPLDASLLWLSGAEEMVPAARLDGPFPCVICTDVPHQERMGEAQAAFHKNAEFTITIDHHANDTRVSDLSYVDADAPATAQLVWEIAGYLGTQDVPGVATCAYTGLMTDTGCFKFQNTDASVFACAASMVSQGVDAAECAKNVYENRSMSSILLEERLIAHMNVNHEIGYAMSYLTVSDFEETGATHADSEPMVTLVRSVSGIRVAATLKEVDGAIRGSLRAKDTTDISGIARAFGGGGHKAAAGFTMHCSMDEACQRIEDAICELLAN